MEAGDCADFGPTAGIFGGWGTALEGRLRPRSQADEDEDEDDEGRRRERRIREAPRRPARSSAAPSPAGTGWVIAHPPPEEGVGFGGLQTLAGNSASPEVVARSAAALAHALLDVDDVAKS